VRRVEQPEYHAKIARDVRRSKKRERVGGDSKELRGWLLHAVFERKHERVDEITETSGFELRP